MHHRVHGAAEHRPGDPSVRTLSILFFLSGFPALVYQLVWQRALLRIFGVNVESVTIVVTAFMLGLGLGSLAGGWISRSRRVALLPLLAAIELATAAFGLASLHVFDAVGAAVLGRSLPVTAAATLALVVVPTVLMGATLPILVGHLVRRTASVGGAVGLLYHVNTLGAAAACLVSAALLFPFLGLGGALAVAAAINVAVAAGALAVFVRGGGRAVPRPAATAPGGDVPAHGSASLPSPLPRGSGGEGVGFAPVLALGLLGGWISLSYELFFFRVVSYATGSSASAFAVTLSAFLAGVAAGARRAARSCRAGPSAAARDALRAVALASLLGLAFLPVVGWAARLGWAVLAVALVLVYLVARGFGVLLPALAHLGVAPDRDAGLRTGELYLANILGSAAGSVVTGFVLLEHLPLPRIASVLGSGGAACAIVLALAVPASQRWRLGFTSASVAGAALAAVALPPLSAGALGRLVWKGAAPDRPPFTRVVENRSGIVAVDAQGTVFGDGMYDGRFNLDLVHDTNGIARAYALGLFHPAPRDVLVIGLSSGSWAQVIANHPAVRSLTIVELNPAYTGLVAETPLVASLLTNPKVRIEVDDGRRWLRAHPDRRFDAIVSNTTYHFRSGATALLSAEFLALASAHLRPGGVLQYNTTGSARAQRTGCATFRHGVRYSNHLALSDAPLDVDPRRWRRTLERWRIDGRPVLDVRREDHRRVLDALTGGATQPAAAGGPPRAAGVEPCEDILARTAGKDVVTDDNMGSEWRFVYGIE